MPAKKCCITCRHCVLSQEVSGGWCRLRQIGVHSELAPIAFCHHWTKSSPSLPRIDDAATDVLVDRQLDLGRAVVMTDLQTSL